MWITSQVGITATRRLLNLRHIPISSRVYFADDKGKSSPFSRPKNAPSKNLTGNPAGPRDSLSPKIVQLREKGTANVPPLSPPPPFPLPPPPPSQQSRRSGSSSNNQSSSNLNRNVLIGLLIAAASAGGAYYAGLFDGESKTSIDTSSSSKKWKPRPVKRNPPLKDNFPSKIPYVLIGGGTASFAAFRAIKSKDPTAKVLLITAEDSLPYMRPPLSKEIWNNNSIGNHDKLTFKQWNGQERSLFYEPPDFYTTIENLLEAKNGGISVATGWIANSVDASKHTVMIEDPETKSLFPIEYEKCLIATGSVPKNLPVFEKAPPAVAQKTILYKNIRDLERLWASLQETQTVAIVGGGFLGSELACSLARRNKLGLGPKVVQVFKESGNMGKVLPEYLSKWTTEKVNEEGVKVLPNVEVLEANSSGNQVSLRLSDGSAVKADVIIVAVGSEPCTQLAESSSLEVDPVNGGYLVNAELEARTDLFIAGDAACFYDPILGRRRVEHHDHAVVSGRLAGENMVGSAKPYKHQSMFWSDLGPEVGYEAIGIIDSTLPTVAVFARSPAEPEKPSSDNKKAAESTENDGKPLNLQSNKETEKSDSKKEEPAQDYSKGIIFYLRDNLVVGIILWNVFNRMHVARQVLADRRKYDDLNEVAKLFNLHEIGEAQE